ncbi:MAG: DUF423 domain-containing protein [Bacteroidota bacterium]
MLNQIQTLIAGAIFGALGVTFGAFGAHAFKSTLLANHGLDTYELAVRYQFYHAFALLIIGLLMGKYANKALGLSSACIIFGVILFSGSLYAHAFKIHKTVVLITPIGGVLLIAGWVLLLLSFIKRQHKT